MQIQLARNQQIQLARNHGPLKPCALNHLHPCSFPSKVNRKMSMLIFSYREKQVSSKKQLDKYLKSSFNGEMFFKFQLILEI